EAGERWARVVEDAARAQLKDVYAPVDETGKERKPALQPYPTIPWDKMDLEQFNIVPRAMRSLLERHGSGWSTVHMIPIESGRGCPYGCEFCTVTGFFGDSIRFRTNESVVDELLRLKRHARKNRRQVFVFFIDDNFAINIKRTKSLLRDIIAAGAQLPWSAQISANLLRDEELVDLIARLWPAHAIPGNAALQSLAESRPTDATETLVGVRALPNGEHTFEDNDSANANGA